MISEREATGQLVDQPWAETNTWSRGPKASLLPRVPVPRRKQGLWVRAGVDRAGKYRGRSERMLTWAAVTVGRPLDVEENGVAEHRATASARPLPATVSQWEGVGLQPACWSPALPLTCQAKLSQSPVWGVISSCLRVRACMCARDRQTDRDRQREAPASTDRCP